MEQYTYDPYGAILFAENFDLRADGCSAHAVNRVGHQGLFFERFDGDYTTPTLGGMGSGGMGSGSGSGSGGGSGSGSTITLDATAAGLYYNRNRFYHPHLGRFMTRDPNETGLPILAALAMNGEAAYILMAGFSGTELYWDGLNLYQYLRSNPISRRDPTGLAEGTLVGQSFALGLMASLFGVTACMQNEQMGNPLGNAIGDAFGALGGIWDDVAALIRGGITVGVMFAMTQSDAVKKCLELETTLILHIGKVATGGPYDPDDHHHRAEILSYLEKIGRFVGRMVEGSKTQQRWLDWLNKAYRWLENPWGNPRPPAMPT